MDTLVDSNILIDIATRDARWGDWSTSALIEARVTGRLVINQLIFAEVGAGFPNRERLDVLLPPDGYRRESVPWEAAHLAGLRFREYRQHGGVRERQLPDFMIAAHAEVAGHRLLTRDARIYRRWFPAVDLVSPE